MVLALNPVNQIALSGLGDPRPHMGHGAPVKAPARVMCLIWFTVAALLHEPDRPVRPHGGAQSLARRRRDLPLREDRPRHRDPPILLALTR